MNGGYTKTGVAAEGNVTAKAPASSLKGSITSQNPYTSPSGGNLIKMNSKGNDVSWLQWQLNALGYAVPVTGQFWERTYKALTAFQDAEGLSVDGIAGPLTLARLKKYHSGGIVDGTGSINDNEVLAILQKKEIVLDDAKKMSLKMVLSGLKKTASMLAASNLSSHLSSMSALGGEIVCGDTFAPQINVSLQYSGDMGDGDATKFGKKIADVALDTLYSTMRTRGISK